MEAEPVLHAPNGGLLAAATIAACTAVAAEDSTFSSTSEAAPSLTPVQPSAEEVGAISLPGRRVNPLPETWERIAWPPSPGRAQAQFPELWVRNVSNPTLRVFLPKPSQASGAAMIVAPGGGFTQLAIEREGYTIARWLNSQGISAFVLKYRLVPLPSDAAAFFQASKDLISQAKRDFERAPSAKESVMNVYFDEQRSAVSEAIEDGVDAIRYVRAHAAHWNLSPHRIGIIGFSAGAVTAIGASLKADAASRPDLVASIYGMLPGGGAVIPSVLPPAFIVIAADDAVVPASSSVAVYEAWQAVGASAELHVFESGGHGFGMLRQGKRSDDWQDILTAWLRAHAFESSRNQQH